MSTNVFEQIMKGAILKGGDDTEGAAERMGAVELKREIAKAEMTYAKSMMRAADAEALIVDLKKGLPPWLKDKKDGDGKDDDKDDAKTGKKAPPFGKKDDDDEAKKAGLPRGFGRHVEGSKNEGESIVDAPDTDAEKSLEVIGREGGEPALQKAMQDAFAMATTARGRVRMLSKALSTIEHGEAGGAGSSAIGASQTSAALGGTQGAGDTSNAEPFGSLGSMNGMPSVEAGQSVQLSEDDREPASQLTDGQNALERTMTHGSAGLEMSANQVMGGDASSGGGMAKGGYGDLPRGGAFGGQAQQAVQAARAAENAKLGYGIPAPAPAPTDRSRGREWSQGMVHYSTNEDSRVAGLMEKSVGPASSVYGGAMGEPTLDMRAPLLKSMTCGLCKSSVPAMFARCPSCGNDHATGGLPQAASAVVLSKSVKSNMSQRSRVDTPVHMPDGVLIIPND